MPTLTLELTDEIDRYLNDVTRRSGLTKGETIRRAFALLKVADEARNDGNMLAVVKEDPAHKLIPLARLVGIF